MSLLQLGHGRVRWIHLHSLLGHRTWCFRVVAKCLRLRSTFPDPPYSDVTKTHSGSTIFVAKLCCCFVDLRFRQTASATMLVTKACHGNLGFVVVVVSRGACFGPPTAFLRKGLLHRVCPSRDPPVCPPMPRQDGIGSKAPTLCVRSVRLLSSCLPLQTCL